MKKILFIVALVGLTITSCSEEFLQKDSQSDVSENQIAELADSPESLLVTLTGLNTGVSNTLIQTGFAGTGHDDFGLKSIDIGLDLMSNDMVQVRSHWFVNYYNYTGRVESSARTAAIWNFNYKLIFNANTIVKNTPAGTQDPGLKAYLGRAKAMRGFAYFNLLRLYGNGVEGVPLWTELRDAKSGSISRSSAAEVTAFIKSDLESAVQLLAGYSRSNKTEVNENVAAGLLARFYLETGEYANAALMAKKARNGIVFSTTSVRDGFSDINNAEWLWGADITPLNTGIYASFFSHMGSLNPGYAGALGIFKSIDKRLFDKITPTDVRSTWFVASGSSKYVNTKFNDKTFFEGDYLFMRGAEMALIEAEAQALAGNDVAAQDALFVLLSKRITGYTRTTATGSALLNLIRDQRGIELWGEGFAFYDMKRWGRDLTRTYTGSNHPSFGKKDYPAGSSKFVFQIPRSEINVNSTVTQNPL